MEYEEWTKLVDAYHANEYKIELNIELMKLAILSKDDEYYKLDEGTLKKIDKEEFLKTKDWIDKLYSKLVYEPGGSK